MLPYALAIAVGLSSLILFSTAFFMSDIHRQDDFFWSGVGLFYALVLWFCATRITGGLLLGQAAAAALIVSNNWQTIKLRRAIANPEAAAKLNQFSVLSLFGGVLSRKKSSAPATTTVTKETPKVTEQEIAIPEQTSEAATATTPVASTEDESLSAPVASTTEATTPEVKVAKKPKTGLWGKLFGRQKSQPSEAKTPKEQKETASITDTNLNDIFDDAEIIDTQEVSKSKQKVTSEENTSETETQEIIPPKSPVSEKETNTETQTPPTSVDKTDTTESIPVSQPESPASAQETNTETQTPPTSVDKTDTAESATVSQPESPAKTSSTSELVEIIDVKIEETTIKPASTETENQSTSADGENQTPDVAEATISLPTPPKPAQDSSPPEKTDTPKATTEPSSEPQQSNSDLDIDEFLEDIKLKPDDSKDDSKQ